jgi:phage terminase large subunit-like protein
VKPVKEKLTRYARSPAAFVNDLIIDGARGKVRLGDAMAEFQRRDFDALYPALIALANGQEPQVKRFWWERTKGASKDTDLSACLLWLLLFSPRAVAVKIGASDRDQAGEIVTIFRGFVRNNPWLVDLVDVQSWAIANDRTGSRADIIAADAPSAHGARPDLTIINELSHIGCEDFAQTMMDNAAKMPAGVVCIATNAGFLETWQWKLRETIRQSRRWHFSKVESPAPWLDPAEINERERTTPSNRFLRLWRGQWVPDVGDALGFAEIEAAVRADGPMEGTEPGWVFVAGLDLGISKDAAAVAICGKKDSHYRLAWAQRWLPAKGQRVSLDEVEQTIERLHARFRLRLLGADPYQAELLLERLSKQREGKRRLAVERVTFTGSNLTAMATMVLDTFNSAAIELYPHPHLIEDLKRLRIEEKSYGMRLSSPRGPSGHGDLATALAVALLCGKDMKPRLTPWIY